MNIELTTKNLHKLCRICLGQGKLNLWQHKLKFEEDDKEIALHKAFRIFDGEISNLDLASEMPLICEACLEDLAHCHRFCKTLEKGNLQIKKLYAEALQIEAELKNEVQSDLLAEDDVEEEEEYTFIDEEEYFEEQEDQQTTEFVDEFQPAPIVVSKTNQIPHKMVQNASGSGTSTRKAKAIATDSPLIEYPVKRLRSQPVYNVQKDAQLVVTKFISTAARLETDNKEEAIMQQNNGDLRTMDYAAVEVQANNLDELIDDDEINAPILPSNYSSVTDDGSQPIYMCKYCPQAFAIPQYLIAHVRKSHVCKFCTKAFYKTNDLHDHLKQAHKQHRCAICGKELSSHSNLRAHIKRLHGLRLPAQVALLDYKPSSNVQDQEDIEIGDN